MRGLARSHPTRARSLPVSEIESGCGARRTVVFFSFASEEVVYSARPDASSISALSMPVPGAAVILNLRKGRSVYAGGGVDADERRLRRSCEEDAALLVGESGTRGYAGGSVNIVGRLLSHSAGMCL